MKPEQRLSLMQMILLTNLKDGFEKKANHRCDCDNYCPKLLDGNFPRLSALELWISGRSVGVKWTSFAIAA